jgi:hypothetical protein
MRLRRKTSDDLVAFDETLQLMPGRVLPPAAKAMSKVFRVEILDRRCHFASLPSTSSRVSSPNVSCTF